MTDDELYDAIKRFAAANQDLPTWQPSILNRYYSKALLLSELAKRTFLMPDATS